MSFIVVRPLIKPGGGRAEVGEIIELDGAAAERWERLGNVEPISASSPPPAESVVEASSSDEPAPLRAPAEEPREPAPKKRRGSH